MSISFTLTTLNNWIKKLIEEQKNLKNNDSKNDNSHQNGGDKNKEIEREKQRKLKEEQAKKIQEKTKTNINQGFIDQTTTTTTKTINTKKVTYIKSNIDNSNNYK